MFRLDGLRRLVVIAQYDGSTTTLDLAGERAAEIVLAGRASRHASAPMPAHEHDIQRDVPTGRHRQPQASSRSTSASYSRPL